MITSGANPRVKQVVQWQNKAKKREKDGVFVSEGVKMFEEAPEEAIREVYVSRSLLQRAGMPAEAGNSCKDGSVRQELSAGVSKKLEVTGYEEVSDEVFLKMSDTRTPQGILTVIKQPVYELETLLRQPNPLFLILEGLQDPGNLGTILRTAEGAGVTGVIMSGNTVDIFNPKTIRATMGSVYRVPFLYVTDMSQTMKKLHDLGIHTYAAHLEGQEYYDSFSFREPTAFLIGNEGNGLSKELAAQAERYVKIPMEGKVESLNAAIAASLLMYEAHRQRAAEGRRI